MLDCSTGAFWYSLDPEACPTTGDAQTPDQLLLHSLTMAYKGAQPIVGLSDPARTALARHSAQSKGV